MPLLKTRSAALLGDALFVQNWSNAFLPLIEAFTTSICYAFCMPAACITGGWAGLSWGERTPPTNKLASGIVVLSVDSWIILMEAAA